MLDGIGDHTARLARTLSGRVNVRVLTAQADWRSLSGVQVRQAFSIDRRRGILDIVDEIRADPPDWVFLQFEQTSYGRWGLNPFVPLTLHRLRSIAPETRIAVMFHEDFMPASSVKFAIMTTWQRLQFWMLGRVADVAFFSTQTRAHRYKQWFPNTSVQHLPVGSNIPLKDADQSQERQRLGLQSDDLVVGVFGSAHPSRNLSHVRAAVGACERDGLRCEVLYVGPEGDQVRRKLDATNFLDAGPLPPEDVSRCFSTMDIYLAPFTNGVSARRGSFLTGLQHGIPTVTTLGHETGPFLSSQPPDAFVAPPSDHQDLFSRRVEELAHSPDARHTVGLNGKNLYEEHFSWPTIADTLLNTLRAL